MNLLRVRQRQLLFIIGFHVIVPGIVVLACNKPAPSPAAACEEWVVAQVEVPEGEMSYESEDEQSVTIRIRQKVGQEYAAYAKATLPLKRGITVSRAVVEGKTACLSLKSSDRAHWPLKTIEDFDELLARVELEFSLKLIRAKNNLGFKIQIPWELSVEKDTAPAVVERLEAPGLCETPIVGAPAEPRYHLTADIPGFTWYVSPLMNVVPDERDVVARAKDCVGQFRLIRTPNAALTAPH